MTNQHSDLPTSFLRRNALKGAAAATFASALPWPANALGSAGGSYLLQGARVLSMVDGESTPVQADIHVADGAIVAVGPDLQAADAQVLDMSGTLIMPGFVDTHWHMWNSIARGLAESRAGPFAKTMAALSRVWTPEASGLSVQLALAEAVNGGITSVNNWAHNVISAEFAEAELAAQAASGVRGRFSYGYPQALAKDKPMDLKALANFRAARFPETPTGLIDLGVCVRGPDRSDDRVWRQELEAARAMRLPLTAHVASDRKSAAMNNLGHMYRRGQMGPDVQVVHATHAIARDFANMTAAGSPLSLSPWTELEVGYGLPPLAAIAASNVQVGLSVDNLVLAGTADMFGVMRLTADLAAGMAETQSALPRSRILGWATRDGARSLGWGGTVGTLQPGRRADLIAVRTDALNTAPVGSADAMLTHAAQPANVDLVMIDGVLHKQGGRLLRADLPGLRRKSQDTIARLRASAAI